MSLLMRHQQQAAFSGRNVSAPAPRLAPLRSRRVAVSVKAFNPASVPPEKRWPNPTFIKETLEAFPDKGIASVDEARVLYTEGSYKYVDVRPKLEFDEAGHVKGAINIPVVHGKWQFDPATKKRSVKREPNATFVAEVQKKFPNKDTPILIGCSDAKSYSMDALEQLDEAGYTNIVALKGGYYAWFRVFDNKMGRRNLGEYVQDNSVEAGDSCGVHSSGAGFERVDAVEKWQPRQF